MPQVQQRAPEHAPQECAPKRARSDACPYSECRNGMIWETTGQARPCPHCTGGQAA